MFFLSFPSLNSQRAHIIPSHQFTLCRFLRLLVSTVTLQTQKSWEIRSWYLCEVEEVRRLFI